MADVALYDEDYYAWTQDQAKALRARGRGSNALDYDRLAEELDALGSEQLAACESFATQSLAHFLKLEHSAFDAPFAGWRSEIVRFRIELERRLTKTLEAKLKRRMPRLYRDAVRLATASFAAHEPGTTLKAPQDCPYTWADVLGRGVDWTP